MSKYPEWVTAHKQKGTEVKCINGNYYLYSVSSHWNTQKVRPEKKSGSIIGRITPEGIVASVRRGEAKSPTRTRAIFLDAAKIAVKEYGLTHFIESQLALHLSSLKKYFPAHWQWIVIAAYCRVAHSAPIKRMPFHYVHSFLSETEICKGIVVTDKNISLALRDVGRDRDAVGAYMKSFVRPDDHIMVDMTDLPSRSQLVPLAKKGYNSGFTFNTQFNLLYIFSSKLKTPVFYRLIAGNLRESKAVRLLLKESGIEDCVFVADRGFYSKENILYLTDSKLSYVIPLKRNSKLIDPAWLKEDCFKTGKQYFDFGGRYVWVQEFETEENQRLYLYMDEFLKGHEEHDYLVRIKSLPERFSVEKFHQRRAAFGTVALVTNLKNKTAKEIYTTYKSRCDVENMFDSLKTVLEADRTYMQNEETLQGWMFANHVALQWYYMLYHLIVKAEKLKKCSVQDVLECLKEIRKVRVNGEWMLAEITSPVQATLAALKIPIP